MNLKNDYYVSMVNAHAHSSVPWQQDVLSDLLCGISLPPDPRILDVGAGIGNNIPTLVRLSSSITAVDVSNDTLVMLKQKYKNAPATIHTIVADIEALPLGDDAFDLVICTEVFEHVKNMPKAITECTRVLKPGGYIILSSPNYFNLAGIVKIVYEWLYPERSWDAWGNHETGQKKNKN